MRLQKYILNEEYDTIESVATMIKKDCKPYLSILRKTCGMLYRGTLKNVPSDAESSNGVYYFKKKPRMDRKPVDMPPLTHQTLDKLFYEKFGWKPRSEGVFVTGDRGTAAGYGKSFLFFPIGDFKYVWSPKVPDLWTWIRSHLSQRKDMSERPDLPGIVDTYTNKNLQKCIELEYEVAIKCKEYYMVYMSFREDGQEFRNLLI